MQNAFFIFPKFRRGEASRSTRAPRDIRPRGSRFSRSGRFVSPFSARGTDGRCAPFPHMVRFFRTYFREMCAFSARGALFPLHAPPVCPPSRRARSGWTRCYAGRACRVFRWRCPRYIFPLHRPRCCTPGIGAFRGKALRRTSRGALAFSSFL